MGTFLVHFKISIFSCFVSNPDSNFIRYESFKAPLPSEKMARGSVASREDCQQEDIDLIDFTERFSPFSFSGHVGFISRF